MTKKQVFDNFERIPKRFPFLLLLQMLHLKITAVSDTLSEETTSPIKSSKPGVSMMLDFVVVPFNVH